MDIFIANFEIPVEVFSLHLKFRELMLFVNFIFFKHFSIFSVQELELFIQRPYFENKRPYIKLNNINIFFSQSLEWKTLLSAIFLRRSETFCYLF